MELKSLTIVPSWQEDGKFRGTAVFMSPDAEIKINLDASLSDGVLELCGEEITKEVKKSFDQVNDAIFSRKQGEVGDAEG